MGKNVRITVLVENSVHRQGLVAEHGLSFHIQLGKHNLLFDTGQTGLVVNNAKALGIELNSLDAIILSHGHYDHTGGMPAVLAAAPKARVYLHPAALESKFSRRPEGGVRSVGMSQQSAQAIRGTAGASTETASRTEILENVFVTGEIPRATTYEDTGGPFFLDAECTRPDPLTDDQALVIDLGQTVILLFGCAHAGVVNTLDRVQQLTHGKPVRAVIGGLHLGAASEERVEQTIARLRAAKLDCLVPIHCTGWPATARLWQAFPETFCSAGVGTTFAWQLS